MSHTHTSKHMKFESVCLCGKNRIAIDGDIIQKFRCFCTDELRLQGNGFTNNMLFPISALTVISGDLTLFPLQSDTGNTITSHLCGACGSLLYRQPDRWAGTIVIRAGPIDDGGKINNEFLPDVEIYTRSRPNWIPAVEGVEQNEGDFRSGVESKI